MPFDPSTAKLFTDGFDPSTAQLYEPDPAEFDIPPTEVSDEMLGVGVKPGQAVGSVTAPTPEEPDEPSRSLSEVGTDLGVSFASGANALLKIGGDLYGLATGDMENFASEQGARGQEFWNAKKSDQLKQAEEDRKQKINASDSVMGKAGTAFWETISSPTLLTSFMFEQVPMMLPMAGVGRGASALTQVAGATAKTGAKVGTGAAVTTGAAMQGADAGSQAYDQLQALPDDVWMMNENLTELMDQGESFEDAKNAISIDLSRDAAIASGIISGVTNLLPGARYLEKALAGAKVGGASRLTNIVKGFAGETVQEGLEEGGGALAANIATLQVDPTQEALEGVGEAIGMGAAAGPFGAIAGATAPTAESQLADELSLIDQSGFAVPADQVAAQLLSPEQAQMEQAAQTADTISLINNAETVDEAINAAASLMANWEPTPGAVPSMPEFVETELPAFTAEALPEPIQIPDLDPTKEPGMIPLTDELGPEPVQDPVQVEPLKRPLSVTEKAAAEVAAKPADKLAELSGGKDVTRFVAGLDYTNNIKDVAESVGVDIVPHEAAASIREKILAAANIKKEIAPIEIKGVPVKDTRGAGTFYHGTSKPVEKVTPDGAYASGTNYYGQGFYTTDAVDVAGGYAGKSDTATLYEVQQPDVKIKSMEDPLDDEFKAWAEGYADLFADALTEDPANLREFYDEVRDFSSSAFVSADEVTDLFGGVSQYYANKGFGAFEHIGGLRTGRKPHTVRIFFPEENVGITDQPASAFEKKPFDPTTAKPVEEIPDAELDQERLPTEGDQLARGVAVDRGIEPAPGPEVGEVAEPLGPSVRADIPVADAGPVSEPLAEVEAAPDFETQVYQTKSVADTVAWVERSSQNKSYQVIASKIKPFIPDGLEYSIFEEGDMAPSGLSVGSGLYRESFDTQTRVVSDRDISLRGKTLPSKVGMEQTFLHEAIHSALNERLREGNLVSAKMNAPELAASVSEMYGLANHVIKELNARKDKGTQTEQEAEMSQVFTNVAEFPTWGLTNPATQEILKSIPYKDRTMWDRFVELLSDILGLDKKENNALSELIDITGRVLDAPFKTAVEPKKPDEPQYRLDDAAVEPFRDMTKKEFLGTPVITSDKNAAQLVPRDLNEGSQKESFLDGQYEVVIGKSGAAVYDGEKVIASYNLGRNLVVDKKYRRKGIAEELVYQWRTRFPGPPKAEDRTKKAQAVQERVWERIQRELKRAIKPPLFRQDQAAAKQPTFGAAQIQEDLKPLISDLGVTKNFAIVQSEADLSPKVQAQIKKDGMGGRVKAVFDNGKITLVADRVVNKEDATRSVLHEVVAHHGLRGLLKEDFDAVMRQVMFGAKDKAGIQAVADKYKWDVDNTDHHVKIADEYIADIAESGSNPKLLDKIIATVRQWLREHNIIGTWSKNDIVNLLARSENKLRARGEELSEVRIERSIKVKETGEVVTLDEAADVVQRRLQKKGTLYQQLLECVGG
jgi:hypothetical protein